MNRQLLRVALLCFLLTAALSMGASAAVVGSGSCGDNGNNLTWTLDDAGTLTISGTGAMADYRYNSYDVLKTPWYTRRASIRAVQIENGVTSIGTYAFQDYANLTSTVIPNSVTSIGLFAFQNCDNLTSVSIPDGVSIGDCAFKNCNNLTSVSISDGASIGEEAFLYCKNLKSVTLSNCSIGRMAFGLCENLASVTISGGSTTIGDGAFAHCKALISVTIPDGITTIGEGAFTACSNLKGVTIPRSVTVISNGAFDYCSSLMAFNVDSENTHYQSVNGVLFDKNLTTLLYYTTGKSGSYVIPDSVTTIEECAFALSSGLTSVTIPNSVATIGSWGFYQCDNLTDVYYGGTETQWNSISISSTCNEPLTTATIHYATPVIDVEGDVGGPATPTPSNTNNSPAQTLPDTGVADYKAAYLCAFALSVVCAAGAYRIRKKNALRG